MWLARLARLTTGATFVLLLAGAAVTSTGSGLAVPDWPLSYGMLLPPLSRGILLEHGHRMIATVVALLAFATAAAALRGRHPPAVRRASVAAALLVVVQAGLGGLTVLLMLPAPVSVAHASLAMVVYALVVCVAIRTSARWMGATLEARDAPVRGAAAVAVAAVGGQIVLGAVVRHTGAGLACPDFPLCHGRLWPEFDHPWIALHFAHRAGALVVAAAVGWMAWRARGARARVRGGAWAALALVATQVALGGAAVLSGLAPAVTVAHHAGGVLLLGTALWTHQWARAPRTRSLRAGRRAGLPAESEVAA